MRVSGCVGSCSGPLFTLLVTILAGRGFAAETTCVLVKAATARVAPTPTGEALATVPAGLSLQVQAPQDGWAKITSPGAAYGAFIPAAACSPTTPEPPNVAPPRTQPTVSVSAAPTLPLSSAPAVTPSAAVRDDSDPHAQPGTQQAQAAAPAGITMAQEPKPLTNEDVLGLVKAGLGSALITTKIAGSPCRFDTSPAALQQLKAAGLPDDVLMAMLQASTHATPSPRGRVKDEMTAHFQSLQNTVLTVWSETGHGTGFVIDATGLILTNHHVVGPSDYIAVQFDPTRKIPAVLLAADPLRDVAVIWADLAALPEAKAAPLATSTPGVEEGERVFTIGSPLNQRKILTTGIASKVEARAILSDVNINPGNSGGPFFNSLGEVVGITTFGDPTTRGPGVSGIVRIEEALPLLEKARSAASGRRPPEPILLPVEPTQPFPLEAIRAAAHVAKLDLRPYTFGMGDYDVGVLTPIVLYRAGEGQREAVRSKEKAFEPPVWPPRRAPLIQSVQSKSIASKWARTRWSFQATGTLKMRRYHTRSCGVTRRPTPESVDSTPNGTRIFPS